MLSLFFDDTKGKGFEVEVGPVQYGKAALLLFTSPHAAG